jgi:hypothetical protein
MCSREVKWQLLLNVDTYVAPPDDTNAMTLQKFNNLWKKKFGRNVKLDHSKLIQMSQESGLLQITPTDKYLSFTHIHIYIDIYFCCCTTRGRGFADA